MSDFSLFLCKKCTPPHPPHTHTHTHTPILKNLTPILPSNPYLKIVIMSSLLALFLKIWQKIQPPAEMKRLFGASKISDFLGFNCVQLIIKIAGLETSRPTFLGKSLASYPETD